jgi:hypothetical protein
MDSGCYPPESPKTQKTKGDPEPPEAGGIKLKPGVLGVLGSIPDSGTSLGLDNARVRGVF